MVFKRFQAGYGLSLKIFELLPEDFKLTAVGNMYAQIPIDPGQNAVFAATIDLGLIKQVRR